MGREDFVPTGFFDLDIISGSGFDRGNLITVVGRMDTGKTGLSLSLAYNVAAHEIGQVLIFSAELTRDQVRDRLYAIHTDVLARSEVAAFPDAITIFESYTVPEIEEATQYRRYMESIALIVIDGALNLTVPDMPWEDAIVETSRSLKQLARSMDTPLVATLLLGKAPERRAHTLNDMELVDSFAADSDMVLSLQRRDDLPVPDDSPVRIVDVHITKNRHGSTATIPLAVDLESMRFRDLPHIPA